MLSVPYSMDENFQDKFREMQGLDAYCQHGNLEDMPLSNEFFDSFNMGSYQAIAPGGLPSPNSSNADLPGSGRGSPLLLSFNPFTGECDSQESDGSSGAHHNFLNSHPLQQSQESRTNTDSKTLKSHPTTNQCLSNETNGSLEIQLQHEEASMTSSSCTDAGQYPSFMAPSEGSLCVSNQNHSAAVPSKGSVEQTAPNGRLTTTHVPIAPKIINTSSASVPASLLHSPTSKSHHFARYPSQLRHQIHSEFLEYSPFATTSAEDCTIGQSPLTMSSTSNFVNCQEPNMSSSHSNYQNVHHSPNRPQIRRIINAHNQSQGSPFSQSYQPFQESSLRSSVSSSSGQDLWQAAQFEASQYPDPHLVAQQQYNRSPYTGRHHVPGSQGNCLDSYLSEQFRILPSNSQDVSSMSQGSSDFDFNASSPLSLKQELSSPDSDHLVSTPILKSQVASLKSHKKRRVKQVIQHDDDHDEAVNPVALQTADLSTLDPTDHANVAALITAMHNTDNVEDNAGMQKTWDKVRKAKALRIKEVCVDLLNLTKQAQQKNGTPLGEKTSINHYSSFDKRFDSLCKTLMFQKTVCKHLIEPPYSYSVVDDPLYAKERVKNNRRVNLQKAEAIRLGREHLGEKGQGKGKPVLSTKKRRRAQLEDSQDDEENSGDEPLSDVGTDVPPHVLGTRSARSNPPAIKKTKRSTNTIRHQQHRGNDQTSYSPEVQSLEDLFAQDLRQDVHTPIQRTQMLSDHDLMLQGLSASPQMPTLNQRYDFQSGNESGNIFYGDASTANSDNDGLGAIGCEFN